MDDIEVAEGPREPPPSEPVERNRPRAVSYPPQESPSARSYVYALGRIEPQFPSIAVEKELAQAIGRAETAGQTDRQAMQAVLADRANRYLARQMCWVFTIQGLETYLLTPRDPADFELLIDAVRPHATPNSLDVVIGVRGPIAPPEACNGLMVAPSPQLPGRPLPRNLYQSR
jgi:hypothetical protein